MVTWLGDRAGQVCYLRRGATGPAGVRTGRLWQAPCLARCGPVRTGRPLAGEGGRRGADCPWHSDPFRVRAQYGENIPGCRTRAYPSHKHTSLISPPSPTAYTRLPTSTAPPHRAYSTRRRRPTCGRPTYPVAPLPHLPPKSPPFDAHLHRAALPFHRRLSRPPRRPPFRPVSTSRSIRGDVPCPRHPHLSISCGYMYSHTI